MIAQNCRKQKKVMWVHLQRRISKPSAISSKLQWQKLACSPRSTCAEKLVCARHDMDKSWGRFLELAVCMLLQGAAG